MDVFQEIEKLLTTFHPALVLGDEKLKNIKYSKPLNSKAKVCNSANFSSKKQKKPKLFTNKITSLLKPKIKTEPNDQNSIENSEKPEKQEKKIKKYEQTQLNFGVPSKRNRNNLCPCCDWDFPESFTENEKNKHVNNCIDGNGEKDIKDYESSLVALKKQQTMEIEDGIMIAEIEEQLKIFCPHCNLAIGRRSLEFRERHVRECFEDSQENYQGNKDIYPGLEIIPKKTVDSCSRKYMQGFKKY